MPMENDSSLQTIIDRRLSSLQVPDDLLARIRVQPRQKKLHAFRMRRVLAVAAVCCFAVIFSVNVVATGTSPGQSLFSFLGNQISSFLQPINHTCVDRGIQTDIIAALNDNDLVDIYVSLKDREASRIDENTMIGDVRLTGLDIEPWVERIWYDSQSQTAMFRIQGACGKNLDGQKLSLSIGSILLNETEFIEYDTGITVEDIQNAYPSPSLRQVASPAVSILGLPSDVSLSIFEDNRVLNKDEAVSDPFGDSLFPWGGLTAGGVTEDNVLRLQCQRSATGKYAQVYDVFLMDTDSNQPLDFPRGTADFGISSAPDDTIRYDNTEYVIPLPPHIDPQKTSIAYSAIAYDDMIQGRWATTFRLESTIKEQTLYPEITVNGYPVSEIDLSPMGISVVFENNNSNSPLPLITAFDRKDKILSTDGVFSTWDDDVIIIKTRFASPMSIGNLSRVRIGEAEIPIPR